MWKDPIFKLLLLTNRRMCHYVIQYAQGVRCTLGARDFSSAVSGFCQVFIVTRAKIPAAREKNLWYPGYVRCNESETIQMFVWCHIKCPQFRYYERVIFIHFFFVVLAGDLAPVLNSKASVIAGCRQGES